VRLTKPTNDERELLAAAKTCHQTFTRRVAVRLVGVSVTTSKPINASTNSLTPTPIAAGT